MKIIVFEGIDASGKETQVKLLKEFLVGEGYSVETEAFPRYNTPVGDLIGKVLRGEVEMSPMAFHLLYEVDRLDFQRDIQIYKENLVDYLIIDRYTLSNIAYMWANDIQFNWLGTIHQHYHEPDLTILLDIEATTSFERRSSRGDLFEVDLLFLDKVVNTYRQLSYLNGLESVETNDLSVVEVHELVKRKLIEEKLI